MKKQVQIKTRKLKSFLLWSMASLFGQQDTIWILFACLRRKNKHKRFHHSINKYMKESCFNFSILKQCLPTVHATHCTGSTWWPARVQGNPQPFVHFGLRRLNCINLGQRFTNHAWLTRVSLILCWKNPTDLQTISASLSLGGFAEQSRQTHFLWFAEKLK